MSAAGLLLTGGSSRRMGADKASLVLPGWTESLATRTARFLASVTRPALEVGPGHTLLGRVLEARNGSGPLCGIVSGWHALGDRGWSGDVVVVATDLPLLSQEFLAWLVAYPGDCSVVPNADGRTQPLCARYSHSDLAAAAVLVRQGTRSMSDLIAAIEPATPGEAEWPPGAASHRVLSDVDTPADLDRVLSGARRDENRGLASPEGCPSV